MPTRLKDALVALSLSNLCFLSVWPRIFSPYLDLHYYSKANAGLLGINALALNVLLLALVLWLVAGFVRRSKQRWFHRLARLAFLFSLILPLNGLRGNPSPALLDFFRARVWLIVILLSVAAAIVIFIYRYERQVVRVALVILVILSPLFLVNYSYAVWLHQRQPYVASAPEAAATGSTNSSVRVLWIVLDELDQRLTFVDRPKDVQLPAFDAFRAQAIDAEHAYPPSGETLTAIPALITGSLVETAELVGPQDLRLKLADKTETTLRSTNNVFTDAQREGFRTGVIGWYHPYCRMFASALNVCAWEPLVVEASPTAERMTLFQTMVLWDRLALFNVPFVFRLLWKGEDKESEQKRHHAEEYSKLSDFALRTVTTDLNLIMVHYPIPHLPAVFDRTTSSISYAAGNDYVDNLVLADRALGDIRRTLEAAGQWDGTNIIVTSDHWFRESPLKVSDGGKRDHRVPFMVKLAHQKERVQYKPALNTVLTRSLIMELLRENLRSPEAVVQWLDQHRTTGESSITINLP